MPPTSTPPPAPETPATTALGALVDAPDLLAAAAERALQTARRDRGNRDAPVPPAALKPFLGFTRRLPARALTAVLAALDEDDTFRARVAEGAEEASLGRASVLFLARPDSWEDELRVLVAADAEERHDMDAARSELSAQRRAEQLGESVEKLRGELEAAVSARADAERSAAVLRSELLAVSAERDDLAGAVARLGADRSRAVQELKKIEALAADRLEQQRSDRAALEAASARVEELESALRSEPETGAQPGPRPAQVEPRPDPGAESSSGPSELVPHHGEWNDQSRRAVADMVERASVAASELGEALGAAAEILSRGVVDRDFASPPGGGADESQPATVLAAGSGGEQEGRAESRAASRPPRRVPIRLRRGVLEGTVEALRQLLANPSVVVIVDGYNVTMEGWPTMDPSSQREALVRALGSLQSQVSARIHVMFDGDSAGERPHVASPLPVRVHFSAAGIEADDVILSTVADLPTDTPVLVVSSDGRVANGSRRLGANVSRSKELLDLLRA